MLELYWICLYKSKIISDRKGVQNMNKFLFYQHGTSDNHGCEAIIRTVSGIISEEYPDATYAVTSLSPEIDKKYIDTENGKYDFFMSDKYCPWFGKRRIFVLGVFARLFHTIPFFGYMYKETKRAAKESVLAVSVGGDNYSYGRSAYLVTLDKKIMKLCPKTVLWGCSINPELLEGDEFKYKVKILKKFSLITARESITYDALKRLGFTNVKYYPDPAFTLPTGEVKEPMFENGKDIVGVNISPLIRQFESGGDITMKSYEELVRYILDNTDMNVALISHVRNPVTDDTNAAKELLKAFPDEPRIKIFDEGNAVDIKGYISKCRFFVAARTHASIAAYSNCIPTLVVGYSVKSTGIAKDLFGTDEGYVIPVQNLTDREALVKAFKGIMENEDSIRAGLTEIMPGYIEQARAVGKEIRALLGESDA